MASWETRGREGWDLGLTCDWGTARVRWFPGCEAWSRSPRPEFWGLPSSCKGSPSGGLSSTSVWQLCSPDRHLGRQCDHSLTSFSIESQVIHCVSIRFLIGIVWWVVTWDKIILNMDLRTFSPKLPFAVSQVHVSAHLVNLAPSLSETSPRVSVPVEQMLSVSCHLSAHCPLQPPDPVFLCSLVGFLVWPGHVLLPTW